MRGVQEQAIPIIEAGSGERKHELAEPHVPEDRIFRGSLGMHRRRSGKANAMAQGGRVLRIEVVVHNVKDMRSGKVLDKLRVAKTHA